MLVMPKRTVKYVKALEVAEYLQMPNVTDQERLYCSLTESGFFWNPDTKVWEQTNQIADPPSEVIRVRLWTDSTKVRGVAYQVKTVLEESGYELLEQSEPYVCRPPKQLDSRVYLTFKQKG